MLELRELRRGDLAEVNRWRADRGLVGCLGASFRYIGPEVDESWFDAYLKGRANTVRCAVVEDGEPEDILGLATLASIDWVSRSCVFHIMVRPKSQGRGVGAFALSAMVEHAFLDLGLRRIELCVLDCNKRARRLYEKEGFVLEGTKRQAAYKGGRYEDMHVMALLRDEWTGGGGSSCQA